MEKSYLFLVGGREACKTPVSTGQLERTHLLLIPPSPVKDIPLFISLQEIHNMAFIYKWFGGLKVCNYDF